ncbi:MAG: antibiotic biosynthesis monooxygenase [Planctomycetaceae bacterium]|nr:antibiotic biosynthesis monooxygenase [Planctomycetaceae bacterium]
MVIVTAKVTASPGRRDEFVALAQDCIAATRREDGCISYELYASTENPDDLLYFERWASQEAVERHGTSAHMAAFRKKRADAGLQVGNGEVAVYTVAD